MPTSGAAAARVGAGTGAVALSVVLAILVRSSDARFGDLVDDLCLVGVALAVVAVVGGWGSVGVAAALFLGAAFAATRFEETSVVDLRVVLVAPALLLLCELVSWSADAATSSLPRARTIVVVVAVGGGVTALIAAAVTLPVGDAVGLAAAGITAVALVTATLVRSAKAVASRA